MNGSGHNSFYLTRLFGALVQRLPAAWFCTDRMGRPWPCLYGPLIPNRETESDYRRRAPILLYCVPVGILLQHRAVL